MTGKAEDTPIRVAAVIIILLLLILVGRLWQLQVLKGEAYRTASYENRLRIEKIPSPRGIIYDRNGKPLVKNSPYYYVSILPEMARSADLEAVADFLSIDPVVLAKIVSKYRNSFEPLRLKGGLTFAEMAYIESRLSDFPSLVIDVDETRHYLYGEVGAHVVGYLGKLNPKQIRKADFSAVPRQTFIGQWGVEKMFDSHLRGEPGKKVVEVDALGRRLRLIEEQEPISGQDLYLSLDIELQQRAEEAFGKNLGALVAIKPATGEILALVSRPSFDPNLFSRGINYRNWVKLANNKSYPMLNRALQSQYPPGSVFKIVTALAALEKGTITTDTEYTCPGYVKKGRWTFRCWTTHGKVSFRDSLVKSCDVYYYRTGEKTGINEIALMARRLHLGQQSGLNLVPEKSGLIPDKAWKRRVKKEPWYTGETYNASIGQGFVLTTPVQVAQMIAIVANGGKSHELTLVRADKISEERAELGISNSSMSAIKNALVGVVNDEKGTGRAAHSYLTTVAGKTGTAQVVRLKEAPIKGEMIPWKHRDHAWFVAFAPADKPEIALAVLVEHGGSGGRVAAPLARIAIDTYLKSLQRERDNGS
jgi:penicillin-binding protein 2